MPPLLRKSLGVITKATIHSNCLNVGINPSRVFSFISDLYSGAISDRAITIRSGLLEKLEPMDDVMADRGFNLRDLVTKRNATLNIPPFAKGKRLSTKACTKTRRIEFMLREPSKEWRSLLDYCRESSLSVLPQWLIRLYLSVQHFVTC